ncbi:ComF family protein [Streptomyces sp. J2-1]|uniref:ComF family protein n=1 Tax=Streptomyces corallincola TaxID=2851888 RepID=UPI001C3912D8|nr:ComF family protein [Streptomyces corallincola]MBV2354310.1 ComF family protein [Streptomyces corallincola]
MPRWWQDLTDLVLPTDCAGCGTPRTALCSRCRTTLGVLAPRRVRPVPEPPGLPVVHAVAPYGETVRSMILAHKERGALPLAGVLGGALARAVRGGLGAGGAGGSGCRSGAGAVLLVPMPSARRAVRARGHDPVRRTALAAARELRRTGTPARVASVLRQRRPVADQAALDGRQRLANLAGALEVPAGAVRLLDGGRVVVVDDLMTTGASLAEAARALRAALGTRLAPVSAEYAARCREGRGERRIGGGPEGEEWVHDAPGKTAAHVVGEPLRAAVIAAPRDSFEINRN